MKQPDSRTPHAWAWWLIIALACVAGIFTRLYQLHGQMLIDDEWHALRKLLESDAVGIATHFGYADYCIPLTLYYRWLFGLGLLNEWQMHLPLLIAGMATPIALPWLLRRELPLSVRATWIGLLAISPALIYYSRTARPYALIALLGPAAILAFRNWQRDRNAWRRWLPVYVAATWVAGWLHLLSLVFTLWPFAFYGTIALRNCAGMQTRARGWKDLVALIGLGLCVVFGLALLLAPPILHDWASMKAKSGAASVTPGSLYDTLLLQFGIANAWLCPVLVGLFLYGVVLSWRRDRELATLILSGCIGGGSTICLAHPAWIHHAAVLVRYAAPVLPFLLLFLAQGMAGLVERISAPLAPALSLASLAALIAAGPLASWMHWPNQFIGHARFQFDYTPNNPYLTLLQLGPMPDFFRELAQRPPGSVTLIETPRRAESNFMPDPWYQQLHRQNVKYALAGPVCGMGGWDIVPSLRGAQFHRIVELDEVIAGAHHGGDYLVMNLVPWTLPPGKAFPRKVEWPDMAACVDKVSTQLGAPVFRDEQIAVFALSKSAKSPSP